MPPRLNGRPSSSGDLAYIPSSYSLCKIYSTHIIKINVIGCACCSICDAQWIEYKLSIYELVHLNGY